MTRTRIMLGRGKYAPEKPPPKRRKKRQEIARDNKQKRAY